MTAPKVATFLAYKSFIKDAVQLYNSEHRGCTFAHKGKVVKKLPITSKTVERLEREMHADTNRVSGLSTW